MQLYGYGLIICCFRICALVLVDGDRCSTQGIVTQCTFYEQYTSQEALLAAAKSHSNRKIFSCFTTNNKFGKLRNPPYLCRLFSEN